MAAGLTKTQLIRHLAEKTELPNKTAAAFLEQSRRHRYQRNQEEWHLRCARPRPSGEGAPQGPRGT